MPYAHAPVLHSVTRERPDEWDWFFEETPAIGRGCSLLLLLLYEDIAGGVRSPLRRHHQAAEPGPQVLAHRRTDVVMYSQVILVCCQGLSLSL
jgi:hypothetical protein